MNWMYWVSGGIALGLLGYLLMALLTPERFS
jgi:K+-transporting ATPase KdpF subunit